MGKDKTVVIKVSSDMKKQIDAFTKKYDVTMAHFIRRAIIRELETDK